MPGELYTDIRFFPPRMPEGFATLRQRINVLHIYRKKGNGSRDMNWRHFGLRTITSQVELNAF